MTCDSSSSTDYRYLSTLPYAHTLTKARQICLKPVNLTQVVVMSDDATNRDAFFTVIHVMLYSSFSIPGDI